MTSISGAYAIPMTDAAQRRGSRRDGDWLLLSVAVMLVGIGLVLVYSSSSVYAVKRYGDAEHFLKLQACYAVLGLGAMLAAARLSTTWIEKKAGWLFVVSVFLCLVVLIPGIGRFVGGARRWLALGPAGFQPSEVAKLAVVLILAALLSRRDRAQPNARPSLLLPVIVAQVPVALILLEPDLGTAIVIELVLGLMLFTGGLRVRTLVVLGLAALPVLYHLVVGTPFRLQRLLGYLDPWAYRSTVAGYQITESLISIGAGGVAGVGLGGGTQKLFFLPAAHTDFIFAILAEELGFIGVLFVVALFAIVVWRGLATSLVARSSFESYLAIGLTALVGVPMLFNVGVATGLLPTKGLPLPLISSGGSNLVVTLVAIGLLLRIERNVRGSHASERDE